MSFSSVALNSRTGCRYLKTANDRYEPHDMLALPDCPADEVVA